MDLADDSFADVGVGPAFPSFEPVLPGSPVRTIKCQSEAGTPLAELRARALRDPEALEASIPKPQII